jgi:acetate CoA/acetoacetate CoA-transferase beta subunit
MAMAADTVVAEPQIIVPVGVLPPDHVVTPSILVDRSVALELTDGMLVNLGIGMPTLVARNLPPGLSVFFPSENGIICMDDLADEDLTDAGGNPIGAVPGSCAFDSAFSFGLIRRGHLDVTVLGGLEVDQD